MPENEKPPEILKAEITELEFLRILDILLIQKQRERKACIVRLKKLGFEL